MPALLESPIAPALLGKGQNPSATQLDVPSTGHSGSLGIATKIGDRKFQGDQARRFCYGYSYL